MTELSKEQSKLEDIKQSQRVYRYSRSYRKENKLLLLERIGGGLRGGNLWQKGGEA